MPTLRCRSAGLQLCSLSWCTGLAHEPRKKAWSPPTRPPLHNRHSTCSPLLSIRALPIPNPTSNHRQRRDNIVSPVYHHPERWCFFPLSIAIMSRRGGREEVREYEERAYFESDGPAPARSRPAPVRARDLLEIDINSRRERERDRQPDFLRQDYARADDQPLVLRKREVETFERPIQRRSPPRRRSPSVERERVRTRVVERERERTPSPVERERVRTRVVERTRERSPSPVQIERVRSRVVERERERSQEERYRTRIVERERERERSFSPPGERIRTRVVERDRERSRDREPSMERTRTTTRIVERERERSPSPIRERERIRTRVVERERERSLSSESSVSLPPEPPIIRAPPIHQEIITHHRHIDHGKLPSLPFGSKADVMKGYDYQPAPTPPPPVRRERARETTETDIDIYKGRGETEIDIHTS